MTDQDNSMDQGYRVHRTAGIIAKRKDSTDFN